MIEADKRHAGRPPNDEFNTWLSSIRSAAAAGIQPRGQSKAASARPGGFLF